MLNQKIIVIIKKKNTYNAFQKSYTKFFITVLHTRNFQNRFLFLYKKYIIITLKNWTLNIFLDVKLL